MDHLRLRPGYVAVRRDDRHLQVGIDPPHRAVVPDTAGVRRLLTDLTAGRAAPPEDPVAHRALDELRAAGLVTSAATAPPAPVSYDGPPDLVEEFRSLIGPTDPAAARIVVLLSPGPLPRERTDPLVRAGTPHLVVEGAPDAWTVGPLVVPGVTACLRCVDAARGETDPRRGLVLGQVARSRVQAHDRLLRAVALPWAAREALVYAAGERPTAWSATTTFRRTGPVEETSWPRHPHCGCAWDLIPVRPPSPGVG
ncbi:hypothetical protein [Nocardioides sp. KR10-350]|uniref:hypothetical protein n=1 Tax=Nocardioides cheoyonin TaxID=3156615 RepID=UPI0032B5B249